jgi:hypothetical protein
LEEAHTYDWPLVEKICRRLMQDIFASTSPQFPPRRDVPRKILRKGFLSE